MEKKHQIELVERETATHIKITLANGCLFRITVTDEKEFQITSVDGAIVILPKVTNQVLITNIED